MVNFSELTPSWMKFFISLAGRFISSFSIPTVPVPLLRTTASYNFYGKGVDICLLSAIGAKFSRSLQPFLRVFSLLSFSLFFLPPNKPNGSSLSISSTPTSLFSYDSPLSDGLVNETCLVVTDGWLFKLNFLSKLIVVFYNLSFASGLIFVICRPKIFSVKSILAC